MSTKPLFTLFISLFLLLSPSANAWSPFYAVRLYEVYWSGLHIGDLIAEIKEEQSGIYRYETIMRSKPASRLIPHYYNRALSKIDSDKNGKVIPIYFDYTAEFRKKSRNLALQFDKEGTIINEIINPPPPLYKYTPATREQKKGSIDPLTASLIIWEKAHLFQKTGTPHEVSLLVFDGRQLYQLFTKFIGIEKIDVKDMTYEVVHLTLHRKAIAGFTKSEMKRLNKQDPIIDVYLENNPSLLPIKAYAKAPIGSATAYLKKICTTLEACMH